MSEHAETTTDKSSSINHYNTTNDEEDEYDQENVLVNPHRRHNYTLTRRPTQGPIRHPVDATALWSGLLAGVAQAGIFNPYDRALYLSVKDNQPFLSASNWRRPYSGFFQSLGNRVISGGLYFPLEHFFLRLLLRDTTEYGHAGQNFLAGTAAGAVNALVLNPLSAIKYQTWSHKEATVVSSSSDPPRRSVRRRETLLRTARLMWRQAGGSVRPFYNGLAPTLYRDVVFGGCYTWLRLQIQWWYHVPPHEQWRANLFAAGLATIVSGPYNYARNVQYATSSTVKALSTTQILRDLWNETGREARVWDKLRLLQNRLRIGWGTARVALGMSFAHAVYDTLHQRLQPSPTQRQKTVQ